MATFARDYLRAGSEEQLRLVEAARGHFLEALRAGGVEAPDTVEARDAWAEAERLHAPESGAPARTRDEAHRKAVGLLLLWCDSRGLGHHVEHRPTRGTFVFRDWMSGD